MADITYDRVVLLAGNPNVGKSSLFNRLTGLRQHTGNWPGKTVDLARGRVTRGGFRCQLVDLPGTYSLLSHSPEEEVARDFICFGGAEAAVVVCDATCLERNLNLALQVMESCPQTVVCINLMDEAARRGFTLERERLERRLGTPVVAASASTGEGLAELLETLARVTERKTPVHPAKIQYPPVVERAISTLEPTLAELLYGRLSSRWTALRLLENHPQTLSAIRDYLGEDLVKAPALVAALDAARTGLAAAGLEDSEALSAALASAAVGTAQRLASGCIHAPQTAQSPVRHWLDRALTSKGVGIPIMLLLLCGVLWLTITGANYPSQLLSSFFFGLEPRLKGFLVMAGAPLWLQGLLVEGGYRVLAWVVAVMLPPMAIFFPLFTLLEDMGYLPRVAFNLDHIFQRCRACGKQCLTICMDNIKL